MLDIDLKKEEKYNYFPEDNLLEIQAGNSQLKNHFIHMYKPFIAKVVSKVCKRYIYETDDEFSIGLIAFNEALELYSQEKGRSLFPFAEIIIKRRVIDYIRKESKYSLLFLYGQEDSSTNMEASTSMKNFQKQLEQTYKKEEIFRYHSALKDFGLTFSELQKCAPKHDDARQKAIEIAKLLVQSQELKRYLFEKKRLPIMHLKELTDVCRKTIERNRKYIIAISIILSGDYRFLKDYVKTAG